MLNSCHKINEIKKNIRDFKWIFIKYFKSYYNSLIIRELDFFILSELSNILNIKLFY